MVVIGEDANGEYKSLWESKAKSALLNGGYILESDKLEFQYIIKYESCGELVVFVYKNRNKKPYVVWTLWVNLMEEQIDFEKSHFVYTSYARKI